MVKFGDHRTSDLVDEELRLVAAEHHRSGQLTVAEVQRVDVQQTQVEDLKLWTAKRKLHHAHLRKTNELVAHELRHDELSLRIDMPMAVGVVALVEMLRSDAVRAAPQRLIDHAERLE